MSAASDASRILAGHIDLIDRLRRLHNQTDTGMDALARLDVELAIGQLIEQRNLFIKYRDARDTPTYTEERLNRSAVDDRRANRGLALIDEWTSPEPTSGPEHPTPAPPVPAPPGPSVA